MSATAPTDPGLAGAREELVRRGYLRERGGPSRPTVWAAAWLVVFAALGSLVVAAGQVSAARAEPALVVSLLAGYLPIVLVLTGLAAGLGIWAARTLLGLGGQPETVAGTLAAAAGLTAAAGVSALLTGSAAQPTELLPGLVSGALYAVAVAVAVRRALLVRLAYRPGSGGLIRSAWIAPAVVAFGALAALAWAARPHPEPAAADEVYPPARGRVAVVAVDGLSREELEAARGVPGGSPLGDVAAWGWAPLEDLGGRLPAVVWATVACGVEPARHGVVELEEIRLFGAQRGVPLPRLARTLLLACWRPFGGVEAVARPALARRAPAFWEMASRAGCPVTVGGWWGSWPVRRLLGEVASERAWLAGDASEDAASPALAATVREAWAPGDGAPAATDRLAMALADRSPAQGTHLLAVSLPALDLEQRGRAQPPPLLRLAALPSHLEALSAVLATVQAKDYSVWLIGVPWHGGTPFVAASTAPSGRQDPAGARVLAATWLDQLGLPTPSGSSAPRRSLSGVTRDAVAAAGYGPPPLPVAAPPPEALVTQREVLRSLGYLQ